MRRVDHTGRQYNEWLVVRPSPDTLGRHSLYVCRCSCGLEVVRSVETIVNGRSKRCQRCGSKYSKRLSSPHGSRHPLYERWKGMRRRCYDPKAVNYERYGGRGIKVCDRWLYSFDAFLADMGECPLGFSLEREDNDGDYSPQNCRWASSEDQMSNRLRKLRLVT